MSCRPAVKNKHVRTCWSNRRGRSVSLGGAHWWGYEVGGQGKDRHLKDARDPYKPIPTLQSCFFFLWQFLIISFLPNCTQHPHYRIKNSELFRKNLAKSAAQTNRWWFSRHCHLLQLGADIIRHLVGAWSSPTPTVAFIPWLRCGCWFKNLFLVLDLIPALRMGHKFAGNFRPCPGNFISESMELKCFMWVQKTY